MLAAGLFGIESDSVTHLAVNCLKVAVGFVVGFVVTGLTAWGFDTWVSHRPSSPALHKLARVLGGVVVAIIVALFVFSSGGGGKGGGTGGPSAPPGTGNAVITAPTAVTPPSKPTPPTQTTEPIRITVLGGYRADEKYYQLDDADKKAVALDDAKGYIRQRKGAATITPTVEIRFGPPATTRDNRLVTSLESWAAEESLSVTFPGKR